jgi:hypothetical protein
MMMIAFKGSHFERDVILWGVRWYVAYPISYRQIGTHLYGCRPPVIGAPNSACTSLGRDRHR